ncbi:MAG: hypothetical protein APR54_08300 [Candidatus Cloacimonas sp. SDB]|nr:MAG: hypothetical protein APR54_08300 [Candidatus Cloacimonas sp. SDB]
MNKNLLKSGIFLPLIFLLLPLAGEPVNSETSLPHYFTAEELLNKDSVGRDFYETEPPTAPVRNIAEFEQMQGVLIRYPWGISYEIIAEMSEDAVVYTLVRDQTQENYVTNQYNNNGVNLNNCEFIHATTNSYWTRDYGPWFVAYGNNQIGIVNFPYNRPRPDDDDVPLAVADFFDIAVFGMNLIHTGGNYMTDAYGISASSDLVLEENPLLSQTQIDSLVQSYLGIDTYHLIPDPNNTYIDHIDCWGKFLAVDKVLIRSVPESHAQYDEIEAVVNYFSEQTTSYGTPYQIYRVYTPDDEPYTNSLILNRKVLLPVTGSSWDDDAVALYQTAMPGYEVLPFTGSWESTDALHCRAKGIADLEMLDIRHYPVNQTIFENESCLLEALIIPYSGNEVISDSLKVYFRVNGSDWNSVPLIHQSSNAYQALIPSQNETDLIEYYLHAVDQAGKSVDHPYMGSYDPHSYTVGSSSPLQIQPDSLYVELPPDSSASNSLILTNTGEVELSYSIQIDSFRMDYLSYTVDILLRRTETVHLEIYDAEDNFIRSFEFENLNPGKNSLPIHLLDIYDNPLPEGIYKYSLRSPSNQITGKIQLK